NSRGYDLTDTPTLALIEAARGAYGKTEFAAGPILAGKVKGAVPKWVRNPATGTPVGRVTDATAEDVDCALSAARPWTVAATQRAAALERAADLYEENFGAIFALLAREAGKSLPDAVSELREAADFL